MVLERHFVINKLEIRWVYKDMGLLFEEDSDDFFVPSFILMPGLGQLQQVLQQNALLGNHAHLLVLKHHSNQPLMLSVQKIVKQHQRQHFRSDF